MSADTERLVARALKELKGREKKFVREYHRLGNAAEACRRAGYSAPNHRVVSTQVRRLLSRPRVTEALDLLNDRDIETHKVDAEWVVNETISLYFEARNNGERRIALKALEMLGKHTKAFVETVEHLNLPQATEEELHDRAAMLLAKLAEKGITLNVDPGTARTIEHSGRAEETPGTEAH